MPMSIQKSTLVDLKATVRAQVLPRSLPKEDMMTLEDKLPTDNGNGADGHTQFEFDFHSTVELEQRLSDEFCRNQKLEKKNNQMKRELQTLKDKVKAKDKHHGTSQSTSAVQKYQTPLGIGGKFDGASS